MKTSTAVALALVYSLAGLPLAYATEAGERAAHPYHHHRHAYHRLPVVRDALPTPVVTAPPAAAQPAPFGLALPRIAPYPSGKGDEDGLSEDPNDCNKGCIGGNTPD